MRTFHPRYVRLLNVLLFSGLGCFSYLLLALYSDLPKRDDLDFTSLGFIIGVMLQCNGLLYYSGRLMVKARISFLC